MYVVWIQSVYSHGVEDKCVYENMARKYKCSNRCLLNMYEQQMSVELNLENGE